MILFIYILLIIVFIFIYFLFKLYKNSFLPLFIPLQILRQGSESDVTEFIRLRENIVELNNRIADTRAELDSIQSEIRMFENQIDIQQSTINTLRNELLDIERILEEQQNITTRIFILKDTIKPLSVFLFLENYIKSYIYNKIKNDIVKLILLIKLKNNINTY
ncbi:hypothetical protein [Alphaentomopoxvirus acuprea]|uniref:Uncharacterized protein n=1 Tax=Alphaentomopoxvirus acuprea TaxID=62099 RepID=W6JPL7_9POXV|nr:hypothetical protein BA82_gp139 [Anomala cuprea entomopoxvirus]BAO49499.1 hypothetical protein [Anomala cuprea entomopoxvirus]